MEPSDLRRLFYIQDFVGLNPTIATKPIRKWFEKSISFRYRNTGGACSKAGDTPLQGACGDFDCLRFHNLRDTIQLADGGSHKPAAIGSSPIHATNFHFKSV